MSVNILSIDGGGTRGIIPAAILDCIHKDFGRSPVDMFDIFAGTSTGGLICIALAAGLSPSMLVELYLNESEKIFYETFADRLTNLDEHLQANYQHTKFKKIVEHLFGDRTLGDLHTDPGFGGKGKHLMVCCFDLAPDKSSDRNKNYRPVIFHSEFIRCREVKLAELALMTCAGPTYFPVYAQRYIDGGVALNNPSMAALTFAINGHTDGTDYLYPDGARKGLDRKFADLQLFSLSTGTGNLSRIEKEKIRTGNWGNIQWIKYLPDLITEANMQSTLYYVKQVMNEKQYYRVELFFDDPDAPRVLKTKPVGLDATDRAVLEGMKKFAEDTYDKEKNRIAEFLKMNSDYYGRN